MASSYDFADLLVSTSISAHNIITTTETTINIPIEKRIKIISSQYVYGMNFFKDFMSSVRNIVGGQVANVEQAIKDTHEKIIDDLKKQANSLGGDAVHRYKNRLQHYFKNALCSCNWYSR